MEIAAGLTAATAALQTVKYLADLDKSLSLADLKSKMASLYSDLADVRMALTDARETIGGLKIEVQRLSDWEDEKRLYALRDVGNGTVAYRYEGADRSVPDHSLCPTCFERGKKAILQPQRRATGRTDHLLCNECGNDLVVSGVVVAPVGVKARR